MLGLGGGDFETALEGAGHMGDKDIANFLLSKGARMNIFCAAMLGRLDVVKAILSAYPELNTSKGPHGLQLLHHAAKGGAEVSQINRRPILARAGKIDIDDFLNDAGSDCSSPP
jgi:ankyrin repeat protein